MRASLAAVVALLIGSVAVAGEQAGVAIHPLRHYGYLIGDEIELHAKPVVPAGYALDREALPAPGRVNGFLELRAVEPQDGLPGPLGQGGAAGLRIRFLVVNSAAEVRTVATPALELRYRRDGGPDLVATVPPVAFTVSPITPAYPGGAVGLEELQPDAPPPRIATRAAWVRLALYAVAAVALAGWCAWRLGWVPRRLLVRRPFALAVRDLRRMRPRAAAGQAAAVARRLHRAFDEAAGFCVASHSLEQFLAAQPWSAGAEPQIREFFAGSARFFYANDAAALLPPERMVRLARALARHEPGVPGA